MKLRAVTITGCLLVPAAAHAGGLFLPGSGAVSTSRAGAAVASASDGEALSLNPAGLAKAKGTTITLSMAVIDYAMSFQRRGTYDAIDNEALPYEGMPYPEARNDAKPPLGIGSWQPIPVIAVVSDLGGAVKGLTVAAGLYAPNAYPFRDMCTELSTGCRKYAFNGDFDEAPPPARYDIMKQEAAILVPTIAAAYRITPQLDLGARFGLAFAHVKSTVALWGALDNYAELVKADSTFTVDANDITPAWGAGVTFRPTPALEIGGNYSAQISVVAKGNAQTELGPNTGINNNPVVILPTFSGEERCEAGGTRQNLKACVELALPMTATLGARYKFLDADGAERGDIELNVGWENWSASRADAYRVVVDGDIALASNEEVVAELKDSYITHGFQDTFNARLGGSYRIPAGDANVIVRGGVGYDTAAAKDGWLRADIDGAARTTFTLGAGYRAKRWEINVGGGYVHEGTNDNPGDCNPTGPGGMPATFGCASDGSEQPVEDRTGPDPITPILEPDQQTESPVNQGTFESSYLLFMLGFSTWF